MRIGCVDLVACVVSARALLVMIAALAIAPVLIKSRRDNSIDSLLSSEIGIVSLIRYQNRFVFGFLIWEQHLTCNSIDLDFRNHDEFVRAVRCFICRNCLAVALRTSG